MPSAADGNYSWLSKLSQNQNGRTKPRIGDLLEWLTMTDPGSMTSPMTSEHAASKTSSTQSGE